MEGVPAATIHGAGIKKQSPLNQGRLLVKNTLGGSVLVVLVIVIGSAERHRAGESERRPRLLDAVRQVLPDALDCGAVQHSGLRERRITCQ